MSLPQQTLQRLPKIKAALLEGKHIDEIAVICNVTEKTVDRDLQKFRASPLFEEWLREEWQRLHYIIINENPTEAYRQLTRLLGQTFTHKIEAKTEVTEHVEARIHLDVTEDEDAILSAASRILTRKRKSQQIH